MEFVGQIVIPEIALYLVGILGLLGLWQYHHIQVLAGRIYAVDFWDVSGIRMLMHATIIDGQTCQVCREANGRVFLPSLATKKKFSTLHAPCANPEGCRCLIVGLYGGWPAATRLVKHLRTQSRKKPLKLSDKELLELFEGPWERGISASTDSLTVHMLEAIRLEGPTPEEAMTWYQYVIDQANGARDLRLLVPAYLRLAEVLERLNRPEAAIEVIKQFEARFARKRAIFYYPSEMQRGVMSIHKTRLVLGLKEQKPQPGSLVVPSKPPGSVTHSPIAR